MAAEPVPGLPVEVVRDVPCRVRDGTTLYADVYRPVDAGPQPALLMREPYDKTTAQTGSGYNHPSWWAAQGWVTVVQDCPRPFPLGGRVLSVRQRGEGRLRRGRVGGTARGGRRPGGDVRLLLPGRHAAARRDRAAAEPRRDLSGHDGVAVLGGLDVPGRGASPRLRRELVRRARRLHGHRTPRRAGDHPARGHPRQRRLVLAPTPARAAGPPPRGRPVLLRLDRARRLRRLLARDRDRRGLRADPGPGAARRRVVRHLPLGHGGELPRPRRPAEAARRTVAARALDPAARGRGRRRGPRRERLAAALPRRGGQGAPLRRLRRPRHRVRDG